MSDQITTTEQEFEDKLEQVRRAIEALKDTASREFTEITQSSEQAFQTQSLNSQTSLNELKDAAVISFEAQQESAIERLPSQSQHITIDPYALDQCAQNTYITVDQIPNRLQTAYVKLNQTQQQALEDLSKIISSAFSKVTKSQKPEISQALSTVLGSILEDLDQFVMDFKLSQWSGQLRDLVTSLHSSSLGSASDLYTSIKQGINDALTGLVAEKLQSQESVLASSYTVVGDTQIRVWKQRILAQHLLYNLTQFRHFSDNYAVPAEIRNDLQQLLYVNDDGVFRKSWLGKTIAVAMSSDTSTGQISPVYSQSISTDLSQTQWKQLQQTISTTDQDKLRAKLAKPIQIQNFIENGSNNIFYQSFDPQTNQPNAKILRRFPNSRQLKPLSKTKIFFQNELSKIKPFAYAVNLQFEDISQQIAVDPEDPLPDPIATFGLVNEDLLSSLCFNTKIKVAQIFGQQIKSKNTARRSTIQSSQRVEEQSRYIKDFMAKNFLDEDKIDSLVGKYPKDSPWVNFIIKHSYDSLSSEFPLVSGGTYNPLLKRDYIGMSQDAEQISSRYMQCYFLQKIQRAFRNQLNAGQYLSIDGEVLYVFQQTALPKYTTQQALSCIVVDSSKNGAYIQLIPSQAYFIHVNSDFRGTVTLGCTQDLQYQGVLGDSIVFIQRCGKASTQKIAMGHNTQIVYQTEVLDDLNVMNPSNFMIAVKFFQEVEDQSYEVDQDQYYIPIVSKLKARAYLVDAWPYTSAEGKSMNFVRLSLVSQDSDFLRRAVY